MSLIVSWIGIDNHGPTSAYICGDSRISWGDRSYFDYGRKVFASRAYPEILGYCGDVLFPSLVVSQVFEMIDSHIIINSEQDCKSKYEAVKNQIIYSFEKYPKDVENITQDQFQFIYITRETKFFKYPKFACFLMDWKKGRGWSGKSIEIPKKSNLLFCIGSGKNDFMKKHIIYQKSTTQGTTRSLFHCFYNTLDNTKVKSIGGAPQLVGIYRKPETAAIEFGIIYKKNRYFLGKKVTKNSNLNNIPWRNELFEICDGIKMNKITNAMPQPDPVKDQVQ